MIYIFGENHLLPLNAANKHSVLKVLSEMSDNEFKKFIKDKNIKNAFLEFIPHDDFKFNYDENNGLSFDDKENFRTKYKGKHQTVDSNSNDQELEKYKNIKNFGALRKDLNLKEATSLFKKIAINTLTDCVNKEKFVPLDLRCIGNFADTENEAYLFKLIERLETNGVKVYGIENYQSFSAIDSNGANSERFELNNSLVEEIKKVEGNSFCVIGNAHLVNNYWNQKKGVSTLLKDKKIEHKSYMLSGNKEIKDFKINEETKTYDNPEQFINAITKSDINKLVSKIKNSKFDVVSFSFDGILTKESSWDLLRAKQEKQNITTEDANTIFGSGQAKFIKELFQAFYQNGIRVAITSNQHKDKIKTLLDLSGINTENIDIIGRTALLNNTKSTVLSGKYDKKNVLHIDKNTDNTNYDNVSYIALEKESNVPYVCNNDNNINNIIQKIDELKINKFVSKEKLTSLPNNLTLHCLSKLSKPCISGDNMDIVNELINQGKLANKEQKRRPDSKASNINGI